MAIDGLLPPGEHNDHVQDLLFEACNLHTLAKLRMHTETTLKALGDSVSTYGTPTRRFQSRTCEELKAVELPRETVKRRRRQTAAQAGRPPVNPAGSTNPAAASSNPKKDIPKQKYNLARYKYHAIADWPAAVREVGTLDNFTSQWVSLTTILD